MLSDGSILDIVRRSSHMTHITDTLYNIWRTAEVKVICIDGNLKEELIYKGREEY